jgi:hypothetical protein
MAAVAPPSGPERRTPAEAVVVALVAFALALVEGLVDVMRVDIGLNEGDHALGHGDHLDDLLAAVQVILRLVGTGGASPPRRTTNRRGGCCERFTL